MKHEHHIKQGLYKEACENLGLTFKVLDEHEYLIRISKGDVHYVTSFYGWPPLNRENTHRIVKDKVFAKQLMQEAGVPTPRGSHFFVDSLPGWEPDHNLEEDAFEYAESIGYPVFVKPHNLSQGRGARICTSKEDLFTALEEIKDLSHIALIEEVVEGIEGRLFCIDGVVEFMYYKKADPTTKIANLAAGGVLTQFGSENIPKDLQEIGKKVHEAFGKDLRIYALDFFERPNGERVVLEVNGQPFLSSISRAGYRDIALKVLTKSLTLYFEEG